MDRHQVDNVNQKPENTAEDVFEAIHAVMHLIRSEQYRALRDGPHDLTHMEGKILAFFAWRPGATLSELVAHFSRDKGQLARLIKTLRKQGLLSAEADPKDRRSVRLHLTREGTAVQEALRGQLKRLTKVAVRGLDAGDRTELVRLITQLRSNLEAP